MTTPQQLFKSGDYAFDKITNAVVYVEYAERYAQTYRYLVRNKESGGFRMQEQLYYSKTDLDGNPIPTTNEA